jgi:hypothetical protein
MADKVRREVWVAQQRWQALLLEFWQNLRYSSRDRILEWP